MAARREQWRQRSRRQIFTLCAAAVAAAHIPGSATPPAAIGPAAIAGTHKALFDLWFPIPEFGLPPPTIAAIAAERLIAGIPT